MGIRPEYVHVYPQATAGAVHGKPCARRSPAANICSSSDGEQVIISCVRRRPACTCLRMWGDVSPRRDHLFGEWDQDRDGTDDRLTPCCPGRKHATSWPLCVCQGSVRDPARVLRCGAGLRDVLPAGVNAWPRQQASSDVPGRLVLFAMHPEGASYGYCSHGRPSSISWAGMSPYS